ncbi:hypothetical protein ACFE04_022448 [Oxalis oulophora]
MKDKKKMQSSSQAHKSYPNMNLTIDTPTDHMGSKFDAGAWQGSLMDFLHTEMDIYMKEKHKSNSHANFTSPLNEFVGTTSKLDLSCPLLTCVTINLIFIRHCTSMSFACSYA